MTRGTFASRAMAVRSLCTSTGRFVMVEGTTASADPAARIV
jgi:hypothetical protein